MLILGLLIFSVTGLVVVGFAIKSAPEYHEAEILPLVIEEETQ